MPTRGVLDRQRVAEAIVATARTYAHPVGKRMQTNLAGAVRADGISSSELPQWIHLQLELARHLEACLDALVTADAEHLAELDAASEARGRRDHATSELYGSIRDLRSGFAEVFGYELGARLLGLRGTTARWPDALLRQARTVVEHLRRPRAGLLHQAPGIEVECAPVADRLEIRMGRLEAALAEVARETEQSRRTGALRSQALGAFDRAVRGVGRVLKGCYKLGGSPELARQVRVDFKAKGGA
jgi:hypothetical protein